MVDSYLDASFEEFFTTPTRLSKPLDMTEDSIIVIHKNKAVSRQISYDKTFEET